MLNFGNRFDVLDLRVNNTVLVLEERRQVAAADVTVLVYSRGKNDAAVLPIPFWVVGASSKERYPERRAGNNHLEALYYAGHSEVGVLSVDDHHHKAWIDAFYPQDSSIQTEPLRNIVKDTDPENFGPTRLGQQQRPGRRFYASHYT